MLTTVTVRVEVDTPSAGICVGLAMKLELGLIAPLSTMVRVAPLTEQVSNVALKLTVPAVDDLTVNNAVPVASVVAVPAGVIVIPASAGVDVSVTVLPDIATPGV